MQYLILSSNHVQADLHQHKLILTTSFAILFCNTTVNVPKQALDV